MTRAERDEIQAFAAARRNAPVCAGCLDRPSYRSDCPVCHGTGTDVAYTRVVAALKRYEAALQAAEKE